MFIPYEDEGESELYEHTVEQPVFECRYTCD